MRPVLHRSHTWDSCGQSQAHRQHLQPACRGGQTFFLFQTVVHILILAPNHGDAAPASTPAPTLFSSPTPGCTPLLAFHLCPQALHLLLHLLQLLPHHCKCIIAFGIQSCCQERSFMLEKNTAPSMTSLSVALTWCVPAHTWLHAEPVCASTDVVSCLCTPSPHSTYLLQRVSSSVPIQNWMKMHPHPESYSPPMHPTPDHLQAPH